MCARIGIVTSQGLTVTLKKNYPKGILYLMLIFSFPAITLNIGADIQGMGAVVHMMLPQIPAFAASIIFTAILMFIIIKYPYQRLSMILKWLCICLLLYLIVPFLVKQDWVSVLKHTFIPTMHFNKEFLSIIVALLGTTISPYLFFWQATMEAENRQHSKRKVIVNKRILHDMKEDVNIGMLLSNVVMFFIILTAGSVLYKAGIRQIDTVDQAAKALEPLAGKLAYLTFTIGVIGTGLLAILYWRDLSLICLQKHLDGTKALIKIFPQAKRFTLL